MPDHPGTESLPTVDAILDAFWYEGITDLPHPNDTSKNNKAPEKGLMYVEARIEEKARPGIPHFHFKEPRRLHSTKAEQSIDL